MHTAPSSAPTSPETDIHTLSDVSTDFESLHLSSDTESFEVVTLSSSDGGQSSEEEVILAPSEGSENSRRDSTNSEGSGEVISIPSLSDSGEVNSIPSLSDSDSTDSEDRACPTPHATAERARSRRRRRDSSRGSSPLFDSYRDLGIDSDDSDDSESSTGTERPSRSHSGRTSSPSRAQSISSASDAKQSIDSFFNDPEYTNDSSNKLRLWQSLCIEFGLVDLEDPLGNLPELSSDLGVSRSTTPTHRVPLPTSLTQAKNLLETKAHVNINRYRKARSDPNREEGVGAYADLVFPNAWAMIRSTRGKGDYADLGSVKEEWLNPLLREFGYRRRRR